MPIYEYTCSDCSLGFELLRQLSQASDTASCPRCHHPAERKLSTFACFTRNDTGESAPVAGTGSSCASCGSASCSTCGL